MPTEGEIDWSNSRIPGTTHYKRSKKSYVLQLIKNVLSPPRPSMFPLLNTTLAQNRLSQKVSIRDCGFRLFSTFAFRDSVVLIIDIFVPGNKLASNFKDKETEARKVGVNFTNVLKYISIYCIKHSNRLIVRKVGSASDWIVIFLAATERDKKQRRLNSKEVKK